MKDARNGRLIVFEGIDGTGKSTQIKLLGSYLQKRGHDVLITREPTDGTYGRRIRALFTDRLRVSREEELELFLADRREHVERELLPALAAGRIILCDRYFLSTVAYQGANGLPPSAVLEMNNFAPDPDIALILEVSVATSLHRITTGRNEQLNDFEQADSLQRVKRIFDELDLPYIIRIDAEQALDAVHKAIVAHVEPCLPQPATEPLCQS